MNQASLTLIVIALATTGLCNGAGIHEHCDDPVLCVDKPPAYDSFVDQMDEFVKSNTDLISARQFDDLEDTDPVYAGDEENCMTVTSVEKPFVIKTNVSSEYVVQLTHFEQKIRITRCLNADNPCFGNVKTAGFGVETFCQEKYGAVSLYIYDPEYQQFRYKMFQIPVCCTCMFRSTMK